MAIIVTAHAHVKPVKDPSMPHDYDAYEIKCHELVSSLWREWVDALLFVRFRTFTNDSEETQRARAVSDGQRVVYTVKQPSFQAKNRYGLPPEMNFTLDFWNDLKSYLGGSSAIYNEVVGLIPKIKDAEKKTKAMETAELYKSDAGKMLGIKQRIEQIITQENS